jgi:hypothetical protein
MNSLWIVIYPIISSLIEVSPHFKSHILKNPNYKDMEGITASLSRKGIKSFVKRSIDF